MCVCVCVCVLFSPDKPELGIITTVQIHSIMNI